MRQIEVGSWWLGNWWEPRMLHTAAHSHTGGQRRGWPAQGAQHMRLQVDMANTWAANRRAVGRRERKCMPPAGMVGADSTASPVNTHRASKSGVETHAVNA